ncbi:MAG TPA: hypothetical protein VHZ51_14370 [Ktedonobacteraceae bacterium]|nr:hypothetical protein [Ktedonobacteraceae bacterium]
MFNIVAERSPLVSNHGEEVPPLFWRFWNTCNSEIKVEAQALWFTRERRIASTGPFQQNGRVPIEKPRGGKTFSVEG